MKRFLIYLMIVLVIWSIVFSVSTTIATSNNELLTKIVLKGYLNGTSILSSMDDSKLFQDESGVVFYESFLLLYPEGIQNDSYTVPDCITVIGPGAFANNSYLQQVVLGNNVLIIDDSAFENCSSLTKIELSKHLYYIGFSAFYNCRNLSSVDIPDSVKHIGTQAFCQSGLEAHLILPNEIEYLGDEAFAQTYIQSVELPSHDFTVGKWIFTEPCDIYTPLVSYNTAFHIAEYSDCNIIPVTY